MAAFNCLAQCGSRSLLHVKASKLARPFAAFNTAKPRIIRSSDNVAALPFSPQSHRLFNLNGVWSSKRSCSTVRASKDNAGPPAEADNSGNNWVLSLGLFAAYAAVTSYGFFFSPNQTPTRDLYFLEKLVGLTQDSYQLNSVFYALFQMMGIWPAVYACLLIPAARSGNKVPAWPFATLSFAFGAFALMPYMVLWQPQREPAQLPPPKEELEGWNRLWMKGAETVVLPGILLTGAVGLWGLALTAGPEAWKQYFQLFNESRMTHVTTIDFCLLTSLAPFWMWNDAEARNWEPRDKLVPLFSVLPLVGPALYLVLRPKTSKNGFSV